MEITIKKIGYNVGTVGWLANGIESGKITLTESISKGGDLSLYLKAEGKSYCLATYNPYGLSNNEVPDSQSYQALSMRNESDDPGSISIPLPLTDACKTTLHNIAEAWADRRNQDMDDDQPVSVSVSFG